MIKEHLIIDTDPGDDDSTSILWVMASNLFNIKAITTTNGNVGIDKCLTNALRTIEIGGQPDIPVYRGAYRPLMKPILHAEWIHGSDGLGNVNLPLPQTPPTPGIAAVEMTKIAAESPIRILALGPLTNVALAILLDPEFKNNVKDIVFMGGAFRTSGNQTARASFNVACDPEAARIVYNSGIPVFQVGLDVCNKVTQRVEDLNKIISAGTPISKYLDKILEYRRNKAIMVIKNAQGEAIRQIKASEQVSNRPVGIGLNDLTATGFLICPQWFKMDQVTLEVETQGEYTQGETIVDYMGLLGREANGFFVYDVQERKLVDRWVENMLVFPGVDTDAAPSDEEECSLSQL